MLITSSLSTCPTCGSMVIVIWDKEERRWTGECTTCGDIIFPTNSKVTHP